MESRPGTAEMSGYHTVDTPGTSDSETGGNWRERRNSYTGITTCSLIGYKLNKINKLLYTYIHCVIHKYSTSSTQPFPCKNMSCYCHPCCFIYVPVMSTSTAIAEFV